MTPKLLRKLADSLFSNRGYLETLWQEIAENFYVERADFTVRRTLGDDYAEHLTSSYPLLVRREFGDTLGVMLRPTQKAWFHMAPTNPAIRDNEARRWMEWAELVQRRAMYDPASKFTRATKEADHDFAAFGQAVISIELNRFRNALLYRTWHLKDVVWRENQDGNIDFVARKWKVAVQDLLTLFPRATLDEKIARRAEKEPFAEIEVMHFVVDAELHDGDARGRPRMSIYYDAEHEKLIEAVPIWNRIYIIPRWQTVSGSQYAFSPATVAGLPDARLLQAMTLTLLEAGEKAVNPPLVATKDVVKSDMQLFPGGVTWVDESYDERLGEALRAMNIDTRGLPISMEFLQDSRNVLSQCFYLNKLRAFNPNTDPEMTAFQAGQIVEEWIRGALPLFEPMEMDYNGQLCNETFDVLYRNGAFGSPLDLPPSLRNADVDFSFQSPLHDSIEAQKGTKMLEFQQLIAAAVQLDPTVQYIPDAKVILRDAAEGVRIPAHWMRSTGEVQEIEAAVNEAQEQQKMLENVTQGAGAAKDIGAARKDIAAAEAM